MKIRSFKEYVVWCNPRDSSVSYRADKTVPVKYLLTHLKMDQVARRKNQLLDGGK